MTTLSAIAVGVAAGGLVRVGIPERYQHVRTKVMLMMAALLLGASFFADPSLKLVTIASALVLTSLLATRWNLRSLPLWAQVGLAGWLLWLAYLVLKLVVS